MVVIGGMGTQAGPIIGAMFITLSLELLGGLGGAQMLVYGLLVVTVCVLKPGGIVELYDNIKYYIVLRGRKEKNAYA
jgi:branched-chain amino acid transport system permease protein